MKSIHGNKLRIFNGMHYSRGGFTKTKEEAQKVADKLRSKGANARIVKVKGGYQIWGRSKR